MEFYATELIKCIGYKLDDVLLNIKARYPESCYNYRVLPENSIITCEYQSNRINIYHNDNFIITDINFG